MNNFKIVSIFVIAVLFVGGVVTFAKSKATNEITYYMMSFQEHPGSKPFGCGEFLVPVTVKASKANLKNTLKAFLKAHGSAITPFEGSQAQDKIFGLPFFTVKKLKEPKKPTASNPIQVYLTKRSGAQLGGLCDDPRATEPLRETIQKYAASKGNAPVKIYLDGSEAEWRCFGDASGLCQ